MAQLVESGGNEHEAALFLAIWGFLHKSKRIEMNVYVEDHKTLEHVPYIALLGWKGGVGGGIPSFSNLICDFFMHVISSSIRCITFLKPITMRFKSSDRLVPNLNPNDV